MNVVKGAETSMSSTQKVATDKALTAFSQDTDYKDCFTNAQEIAHRAVAEGLPPVAAARLGFAEAKTKHLEPKKEPTDLGRIGTGKQIKSDKQPTLPAQFKAQMKKDIEKGVFDNEADWIASLSPENRLKYSI
jgi:hypothetical protein